MHQIFLFFLYIPNHYVFIENLLTGCYLLLFRSYSHTSVCLVFWRNTCTWVLCTKKIPNRPTNPTQYIRLFKEPAKSPKIGSPRIFTARFRNKNSGGPSACSMTITLGHNLMWRLDIWWINFNLSKKWLKPFFLLTTRVLTHSLQNRSECIQTRLLKKRT